MINLDTDNHYLNIYTNKYIYIISQIYYYDF